LTDSPKRSAHTMAARAIRRTVPQSIRRGMESLNAPSRLRRRETPDCDDHADEP
jgi:hypothetical protein